jgi:hypothetical protein
MSSKKPAISRRQTERHFNIFLSLSFDPEDGRHTFLRNIGGLLTKYNTLQFLRISIVCFFLSKWYAVSSRSLSRRGELYDEVAMCFLGGLQPA